MSLLVLACTSSAANAALRDLQAHGSEDHLWLARTEPLTQTGAVGWSQTTLFMRAKSDSTWRRLDPIESPVLALANRGSQLAVLLSNGDWLLMTDTSPSSGLPLPGKARIIALGSDAQALWAVGLTGTSGAPAPTFPTSAPTTRATTTSPLSTDAAVPATAPATAAASRPATTAPSTGRLTLYRLGPQAWKAQGPLPDEIPAAEGVSVSLAVVGGMPVIAQQLDYRHLRVFQRTDLGKWEVVGDVHATSDLQDYKALGGLSGPAVWTRGSTGPSQLWIAPTGGAEEVNLELPPTGRDQADHAVVAANGALRLLWVEDNKIFDQRLNPRTAQPEADAVAQPLPAAQLAPVFARWAQIVLMAAVIFAMAASVRRRQEMQEVSLDPSKLPLAPYSSRLAAGAIDVLPAFAAGWLARALPSQWEEIDGLIPMLVGMGVYVLLTSLVEVLAGRSLGKMATGLRVVGLDGKPAATSARVVRNVLRIIDLPVMPLALILFSPLRQRAGDLAAGTLVVGSKVAEEAVPADDASAEAAQAPNAQARNQSDESMPKPE